MTSRREVKKKGAKAKKKILAITIGLIVGVFAIVAIGYSVFRQSHFAYGETISGESVSLMSVDAAYGKLKKINQPMTITIENQGKTQTIQAPVRYELSKEDLKSFLKGSKDELASNPKFDSALKKEVDSLKFTEDKGKNAFLQYNKGEGFKIVPEVHCTIVNRDKLQQAIKKAVEEGGKTTTFNASNFYNSVAITKENADLKKELEDANSKIQKKITLKINKEDFVIPRDAMAEFINSKGEVDKDAVYNWVKGPLNKKFATIDQTVHWKNPKNGKTYEYQNNGAYGWDINFPDGRDQIVKALDSKEDSATLTLKLDGNVDANPRDIKDFVYIDLLKQMEYIYRNNKQVVSTRIISGRNNKGTATTPGFLTIGYKDRNAHLRGVGLDGKKYDVPVSYWEPLLSRGKDGPYYTGIGMHDSNNKDLGFQDVNAWQTLLGSNGCINHPPAIMPQVWDNTYAGMAVIIQGDLYANSPGAYDKPVDFGKVIG